MIKLDVKQVEAGVKVTFSGDATKESINTMLQECASGECSCECDPELFSKIEKMEVAGEDGNVELTLSGKKLDEQKIREAAAECVQQR